MNAFSRSSLILLANMIDKEPQKMNGMEFWSNMRSVKRHLEGRGLPFSPCPLPLVWFDQHSQQLKCPQNALRWKWPGSLRAKSGKCEAESVSSQTPQPDHFGGDWWELNMTDCEPLSSALSRQRDLNAAHELCLPGPFPWIIGLCALKCREVPVSQA